jgi:putative sigma-54 modulation protein
MKILIEPVHFTADQSLLDYIEKKIKKLEQFYDRIIDVQVTLKLENSGQVRDKVVEVLVSVPGDRIFNKDTQKTFEAAVDKVAAGLKRQLIKRKEMMRTY